MIAKTKISQPIKKAKKASSLFARFVSGSLVTLSLIAVGLLWLSVASTYVSPEHWKYLSLLGLAFPIFLVFTMVMFVLCLMIAWKRAWIPLIGMLVCGPTIYNYFPLNLPSPAPKEGLKVMTFNTHCFGNLEDGIEINDAKGNNVVAKFIMEKAPDLVGYQEGVAPKKFKANVQPLLNRHGYYADSVSFSGNRLGCFSKFPIAEKQVLCQNDGNGAVLFKLLPPQQDTIFFIVAHLQTMRLNKEDRKDFLKNISQLLPDELAEQFTFDPFWRIAKKIATSSAPRAQQADKLAQFIESHADRRIILCGDFNDTPVSYTYRTIRQAGPLDDAFVATGNGMGRTFNKNAMMVRIDHIFYNANVWSAHASRIHNEKEMSDHYAVTTCLQEL